MEISRFFKLHKLFELPDRWRELESRLQILQQHQLRLQREIDITRSSLEISDELICEFQEWKEQTALPANPLVSVCIATYNRSPLLLERAVPSILNQTYTNFELIVVGDACTDDTAERLAGIKDPRLCFVNLPQRGRYPKDPKRRWMVAGCQPMNAGIRAAKGDLITQLDDDDAHLPNRLEALVNFCRETRCDFAWHPFWVEKDDGQWEINPAENMTLGSVTTGSVIYRSWFKSIELNAQSYRLLEPADWNRFRRIAYLGADCRRYPEPLLRHFAERRQLGR